MTFGARLTEARKRKQLTQDGLGKGLGTDGKDASKAVVYGWEKDQHFPRVDQLALICERLGCSADYLLFGELTKEDWPFHLVSLEEIQALDQRELGIVEGAMLAALDRIHPPNAEDLKHFQDAHAPVSSKKAKRKAA
jgi:transcriptional regulator with XRE-family HTH domain